MYFKLVLTNFSKWVTFGAALCIFTTTHSFSFDKVSAWKKLNKASLYDKKEKQCQAEEIAFAYDYLKAAEVVADTPTSYYEFDYSGKTYWIVKEEKSWVEAAAIAVGLGGYLVHIDSAAEQTAISNAINASGISTTYTTVSDGGGIAYIWIGANDIDIEGIWVWDGDNQGDSIHFFNGTTKTRVDMRYKNWGSNIEPDNYGTGQDAAAIGLAGWPSLNPVNGNQFEWNDIQKSNTLYYIIEDVRNVCTNDTTSIDTAICMGSSIDFNGMMLDSSGIYYRTFVSVQNCDSIVSLTLSVTALDTGVTYTPEDSTLTVGESDATATFQWLNYGSQVAGATEKTYQVTASGEYAVIVTKSGCTDTSARQTINFPTCTNDTTIIDTAICMGSSIDFNGTMLDSSGTYYRTFVSVQNCDSIISLTLSVTALETGVTYTPEDSTLTVGESDATAMFQWLNYGATDSLIVGATEKTYQVIDSGEYAVIVTKNGCTDTSVSQIINFSACTNDTVIVTYTPEDSTLTVGESDTTAMFQWLSCGATDSLIVGAIGKTYQVTAFGEYAVIVTKDGYKDTSVCLTVDSFPNPTPPLGIVENNISSSIRVYPNPTTNGFMTLDFMDVKVTGEYEVLLLSGKVIAKGRIQNQKTLGISLLKAYQGIYILRIIDQHGKQAVIRLLSQ